MKSTFVFLPSVQLTEPAFLHGDIIESNEQLTIYVTNITATNNGINCIGFCSERCPQPKIVEIDNSICLHVNIINSTVSIVGGSNEYQVTLVHYDKVSFKQSIGIIDKEYGIHFEMLMKQIQRNEDDNQMKLVKLKTLFEKILLKFILLLSIMYKGIEKFSLIGKQSAFISHSARDIKMLLMELNKLLLEKKVSTKLCNLILCKILDLLLGYLIFYHFSQHSDQIVETIEDTTNVVISALKEVLLILMGSPAGLKLNYSFNRTLGIFAFYNISLWRGFLRTVVSPLFNYALSVISLPVLFGLSYQIALFTDVLAFTTFHVYCIYVYAARLYGLQIKALASLWRLFIGRKYNPLRGKVDSYSYSHHQLFLGILVFTILLFLLPTTMLYYTVFLTFRIGLICLYVVLEKLIFMLRCNPLRVLVLWLSNAGILKGEVYLWVKIKGNQLHHLEAKLCSPPIEKALVHLLPEFLEEFKTDTSLKLSIHKIIVGQLI